MKEELKLENVIRSTWMSISKMYNTYASEHDSTMANAYTLLCLDPEKGTPSTQLGPKMGIKPTSLSRVLKELEQQKLIVREKNPHDKRGVLVSLTDLGKEKRSYSETIVAMFHTQILTQIPKNEMEEFYVVLKKIYDITKQLTNQHSYEESTY